MPPKLTGKSRLCNGARHPRGLENGARRPAQGGCGGGQEPHQAAAARTREIIGTRALAIGDLLRRRQLCRSCRGKMARRMNRPPEPDPHTQGLKAWQFHQGRRETLADPSATVKISGYSSEMDWEVELAAGDRQSGQKTCPRTRRSITLPAITAANDLSARDPRAAGEHQRHLPVQVRLDQAQDFRRLLPAGPLDRAGARQSATRKISASSCG